MKVAFRIQSLLRDYRLHKFGIETEIAEYCQVNRHTIGKIFRNQAKNPSLEVLGRICGYLVEKGVPAEILPGALFSCRPAGLWKAIGRSKRIAIYLGRYKHLKPDQRPGPAHETIASADAAASGKISHLLSSKAEMGDSRPLVETRYVPFTFQPVPEEVAEEWFEQDKLDAEKIYEAIRTRNPGESAFLLGSQRANYLVEFLVADFFGCQPFKPVSGDPRVPFYLSYRDFDRPVPSCFGGRSNPPWVNAAERSGIWFLDKDHRWQVNPWVKNEQGSGIVITICNVDSILIALFGFSGRSTYAICKRLIEHPQEFWDRNDDEDSDQPRKEIKAQEKETTSPGRPKAENRNTGHTVFWNSQENSRNDEDSNQPQEQTKAKEKKSPGRPKARNHDTGNTVFRDSQEIGVHICRVKFCQSDEQENPWMEKPHEQDEVDVRPLSRNVLDQYLPSRARQQSR